MKGWFVYLFIVLFGFSYGCLAAGHAAYAHFEFCNSLKSRIVTLKPEGRSVDLSEGFKEFLETEVSPQQKVFFKEELSDYQEITEITVRETSSPMLIIGVYVKGIRVGLIKLVRTLRPDPSFVYETEKNSLGLELRIQRSRFGGGPKTIEIAPRLRLQR